MIIKIISPQSVEIDGSNFGGVADTIANNHQFAAQIQMALNAWYEALQLEQQTKLEALQQQITGESQLTAEKEALTLQVQALQAELEVLRHPPQPLQNWDLFRTLMMTDADYQTMLQTVMSPSFGGVGNWLGTTMQQAISMAAPAMPLVKPLWQKITSLSPPSLLTVERWRGYALDSGVPIVFLDDGSLGDEQTTEPTP